MDYLVFHRMGKVGSHSILHSLRASAPELRVDQAHFLTPQALDKLRRKVEASAGDTTMEASQRGQLEESLRCVEEIEKKRKQGRPYCVLSGYRDPLDQVVASLFQILPNWFPEVDLDSPDAPGQAAFMVEKFHTMFRRVVVEQVSPTTTEERRFAIVFVQAMNWFDREFKPFHGVDLYEHEPDALGTFRIERGPVLFLVYKMESLRGHFDAILKQVPGVQTVEQINDNEAAKKKCAALYREFRRQFQPTAAMHDFYYQSRYFRHFYRNDRPHFARPGGQSAMERPLRMDHDHLHEAARRVAELEAVRRELQEARELIGRMEKTKIWRFRNWMRRILLRSRQS